jgi:hypothetical protein
MVSAMRCGARGFPLCMNPGCRSEAIGPDAEWCVACWTPERDPDGAASARKLGILPDLEENQMTTKTTKTALADKLSARAAGLAAAPGAPSAMPAEAPKPPAAYSARISHTTTPGQLEALEALRTAEKASGGGAVSITALLRAATALCLDDPRLRARWIKAARGEWR